MSNGKMLPAPIQPFNFDEFEIRTVEKNGEFYFIGKDVCKVFGDSDHNRSLSRLDEDEKLKQYVPTPSGNQEMITINESGLYSLLFNMQPQKAHIGFDKKIEERLSLLKSFKRWVTHVVLPSIRKTGTYDVATQSYLNLSEEDRAIAYFQDRKKIKALEMQAIEDEPKIQAFDDFINNEDWVELKVVSNLLVPKQIIVNGQIKKIGRNLLIRYLTVKGELCKKQEKYVLPTQEYINREYYKAATESTGIGNVYYTVVSPKGIEHIRQILKADGIIIGANLNTKQKKLYEDLFRNEV